MLSFSPESPVTVAMDVGTNLMLLEKPELRKFTAAAARRDCATAQILGLLTRRLTPAFCQGEACCFTEDDHQDGAFAFVPLGVAGVRYAFSNFVNSWATLLAPAGPENGPEPLPDNRTTVVF